LRERRPIVRGPLGSCLTVSPIRRHPLLAINPADRTKRPRNRDVEPGRVWSADQLDAFLMAAQPHRPFAFYRLAAYTGARRGELLCLRWDAVDLDAAEVTFGGSTAVVRGQRFEGTTKGGRSRVVSIDRETVAILREHRDQRVHDQLTAGSACTDSGDLIFVSRWGEALYPDTALMTKMVTQYNKTVPATEALPHARLHDLRHLHATTLLLAGVPVHVVAARLGHADPAVTLRVYSHVLREHAEGIGDVFAQAIKASVSKSVSNGRNDSLSIPAFPLVRWVVRGGVEPPTFRFSGRDVSAGQRRCRLASCN
jgi:integrase